MSELRRPVEESHSRGRRRALCIFPKLTNDLSKSAHMLMLKYARKYDWSATVITLTGGDTNPMWSSWEGIDICRVVPKSVRYRLTQQLYSVRKTHGNGPFRRLTSRLLLPAAALLSYPDDCAGAVPEIQDTATQLLSKNQYDVLVSLYSPLSAHAVASRLASTHQLPWLALTKDFFSWPEAIIPSQKLGFVNKVKRRTEVSVLRHASLLATVSDYMTEYMHTLMPDFPVVSLPHCFDSAAYANHDDTIDTRFTIVCVGRTIEIDRPGLELFFGACRELLDDVNVSTTNFRICFVGSGHEIVSSIAKQYNCNEYVEYQLRVDHQRAIQYMCEAQCLLYVQTPFGTRRRLTEYIGSRRPILAVGDFSGTMSSELLRSYGAGRIATTREHIKHSLGQLLANKWSSEYVNGDLVLRHSADVRGRELANILNGLSKSISS